MFAPPLTRKAVGEYLSFDRKTGPGGRLTRPAGPNANFGTTVLTPASLPIIHMVWKTYAQKSGLASQAQRVH